MREAIGTSGPAPSNDGAPPEYHTLDVWSSGGYSSESTFCIVGSDSHRTCLRISQARAVGALDRSLEKTMEKKTMTCIYCTDLETLECHHAACPARSGRVSIPALVEWRRGYDEAAIGHIDTGEAHPTYQLGWSMRITRESPPQLRPAMFLSLRALLERLRGRDLRTDTFGIWLPSSLFYLDGDLGAAYAVARHWPAFPHLRDPSDNQGARLKAEFILATSRDEAERAYAKVILEGDPDDEIRAQVLTLLRGAEASGRLIWHGDRAVDLNEVDAFLARCSLAQTSAHRPECNTMPRLAAAIEAANGDAVLAAA